MLSDGHSIGHVICRISANGLEDHTTTLVRNGTDHTPKQAPFNKTVQTRVIHSDIHSTGHVIFGISAKNLEENDTTFLRNYDQHSPRPQLTKEYRRVWCMQMDTRLAMSLAGYQLKFWRKTTRLFCKITTSTVESHNWQKPTDDCDVLRWTLDWPCLWSVRGGAAAPSLC